MALLDVSIKNSAVGDLLPGLMTMRSLSLRSPLCAPGLLPLVDRAKPVGPAVGALSGGTKAALGHHVATAVHAAAAGLTGPPLNVSGDRFLVP